MTIRPKIPFPPNYPTGNRQVYQLSERQNNSTRTKPDTNTSFTSIKRKRSLLAYFSNMAKNNPGLLESNLATIVVCTIRPLTVLMTPGADKRDKQYAATQSIASGIVGFIAGYVIFNPLKNVLDKLKKQQLMRVAKFSEKSLMLAKNKKAMENFINIFNNATRIWTAPITAFAMISLLPVLMKKFFPNKPQNFDKSKDLKSNVEQNAVQKQFGSQIYFAQNTINNDLYKKFLKEGNK